MRPKQLAILFVSLVTNLTPKIGGKFSPLSGAQSPTSWTARNGWDFLAASRARLFDKLQEDCQTGNG